MNGKVQKKFTSKKGTPCLEIGGQVYIAPKVDISNVQVGDSLEFQGHSFGDGKMWELDSFRLTEASLKYPSTQEPSKPDASPATPGAVMDAERPCISNWGAELIKAGIIKDPADLGIWVAAMKGALRL